MEQLIEAFGIDTKGIVIQIINFAILAAALTYFLYNPVLKLLNEREETIKQGLKDAEDAKQAKESAEEEKKAVLGEANKEAEAVAARAKEHADEKTAGIVATADEKAAAIVKDAEAKSEEMKAQARKDSEAEISKLAILAAEKILRKEA
ncbi:MAG: F0F1 ATP synthase subunit B [Patescibacteria group bacterium]